MVMLVILVLEVAAINIFAGDNSSVRSLLGSLFMVLVTQSVAD